MSNQSDKPAPTLAETLVKLTEEDEAFSGVDRDRVLRDAADYYDNDLGRCGQFMVSRGTLTPDQLQLALARQAQIAGDHKRVCSHLQKLTEDTYSRGLNLLGELSVVLRTLAGRVS